MANSMTRIRDGLRKMPSMGFGIFHVNIALFYFAFGNFKRKRSDNPAYLVTSIGLHTRLYDFTWCYKHYYQTQSHRYRSTNPLLDLVLKYQTGKHWILLVVS